MSKLAFIMDPLAGVKAHKDTTYFLMLGAAQLGHQVFYLDQRDLYILDNLTHGRLTPLTVSANEQAPFEVGQPFDTPLNAMDLVFIRTDPPFDRRYFYTTLMLDHVGGNTLVVNRPSGLRNLNEKKAALYSGDLTPATLVTQDPDRIQRFMADCGGKITLKPVDGHGGRGIFILSQGMANLDQIIDTMTHRGQRRVIAQAYVPEAKNGDKRILLLMGEPLGAILRVHAEGKELNNLDAGGKAHPVALNPRDLEICAQLKPLLQREGIYFTGIDILGDYLIEVNVTSPTGLREMSDFAGKAFHQQIIETLLGVQGGAQ